MSDEVEDEDESEDGSDPESEDESDEEGDTQVQPATKTKKPDNTLNESQGRASLGRATKVQDSQGQANKGEASQGQDSRRVSKPSSKVLESQELLEFSKKPVVTAAARKLAKKKLNDATKGQDAQLGSAASVRHSAGR
mmetsp:Transcript_19631/g.33927  ORF Transcript_19631/g.33927 Transcript_19631/m.33927 type:complete len:138 (-) Transcript_19631:200-613(-)